MYPNVYIYIYIYIYIINIQAQMQMRLHMPTQMQMQMHIHMRHNVTDIDACTLLNKARTTTNTRTQHNNQYLGEPLV